MQTALLVRHFLLLFLGSLLILSCQSTYVHINSESIIQKKSKVSKLSTLVLGVSRVTNETDLKAWMNKAKDVDFDRLIELMRAHKVFKQVDYTQNLSVKPDLVLKNVIHDIMKDEKQNLSCVPAYTIMFSLPTLTVLPIFYDGHHHFDLVFRTKNNKEFVLNERFEVAGITGVWAPLFSFFSDSYVKSIDDDDIPRNFKEKKVQRLIKDQWNYAVVDRILENQEKIINEL